MNFNGKALYNLLKVNWKKNPSMKVESWQVEDYRSLPAETIFSRLNNLEIVLNEEHFRLHATNCDTPEELVDYLWTKGEDPVLQDQAYLLLFELWRRLLPERRSLSIFCDTLDDLIERYSENPHQMDEEVQMMLHNLEDVLDENVDLGGEPKEVFRLIEESSAHDVESFLYEYIAIQIEENNALYASELLDGFYGYIKDPKWFDFLRARLFVLTNSEEAALMIERILEQLEEIPDVDLLFEIISYLATEGEYPLFAKAVNQAIPFIETEEDLSDLLGLVSEYYRRLDQDEKVEAITRFLNRTHINLLEDSKAISQFLTPVE